MSELLKVHPNCSNCKCTLSNFTGIHEMRKSKNSTKVKTVCGLCAALLEVKGWKVIKNIVTK